MNPPQFDRMEDITTLRYLNESSVLHTLRQRYGSNLIHSYAGSSLLLVNPMHPLSIYSEKVNIYHIVIVAWVAMLYTHGIVSIETKV